MKLKPEDMEKLEKEFFKCLQRDNIEYGGIGLDSKRPFGNSSVEYDILEIIGQGKNNQNKHTDKQLAYANSLYDNLIPWLQNKYMEKKGYSEKINSITFNNSLAAIRIGEIRKEIIELKNEISENEHSMEAPCLECNYDGQFRCETCKHNYYEGFNIRDYPL